MKHLDSQALAKLVEHGSRLAEDQEKLSARFGEIADVVRETKLGGPTHTKGVLILAGYLLEKLAQNKSLSVSARLVFEQSYSGVEGDSASSAELYALLSELSGLSIFEPLKIWD